MNIWVIATVGISQMTLQVIALKNKLRIEVQLT